MLLFPENHNLGQENADDIIVDATAVILNEEITLDEIISSINTLKTGKGAGPDSLSAEFYNKYRYMGLLFTPKLSWSKAKRKLAAQARKAIFCIQNYQRKFCYFKHEEIFRLFDSMVKPILCYGSEVWGTEL